VILSFLKEYWTQLIFVGSVLFSLYKMYINQVESTKCSLRNDILSIYDHCKPKKQITVYQKQAVHYSADLYEKRHGNSFVESIVKEMDTWDVID